MRMLKWLLVAVVLVGAVGAYWVVVPYGLEAETFVEIAPGTGTVGIAEQLQKAGVVRSAWAFEGVKAWRGVAGGAGSLKAGEYRFDHAATVGEVYDRLRRGDVYTVTVVIPEGFNVWDVAGAVAAAGLGSKEDFLRATRENAGLVKRWSPGATSVEGYLFPDTYKFQRHATDAQMIAAMVKRFGQVGGRLGLVGAGGVESHPNDDEAVVRMGQPGVGAGLGDDEKAAGYRVGRVSDVVTMASLVEKEVHVDSERAVVAGVFVNRLGMGMPLQTDPAVVYASMLRGTWTGVIHQSELHSDSAYNTYAHKGLPPGPICSPGVAALKAAMHPAKTDYLYFVADANGATRFSTGLAEHNGKVAEYRSRQ